MKRNFLRFAAGTLAAAMLLPLQGCSPMTPAKTAERVAENMAKTPCTAASVTGQMDLSIGMMGLEVDTTVSLEQSLLYSADPQKAYADLEMGYEMMGVRVPLTVESYLLEEDGKMVQYLHTNDVWMTADADATMVQAGTAIQFNDPGTLAFDETVEELDGVPAVCLTGTVSGEALSPLLGNMLGELAGAQGENPEAPLQSGLDFSGVSADVRMYVNKETYLPIRMECSVSGLDTVMNSLLEDSGITYTVNSFTMNCDYTSYEPQEIPELPAEAHAAAEQAARLAEGNPDNGNGIYTIREGNYYMDIATPEGYAVSATDYDMVQFYSEELDRTVKYQMYTTVTQNDLGLIDQYYTELMDTHPALFPDSNFYNSDTLAYSLMWIEYEENDLKAANYYAWAYMEDQVTAQSVNYPWIVVRIQDGGAEKDASGSWEEICALLDYAMPYDLAHLAGAAGTQMI